MSNIISIVEKIPKSWSILDMFKEIVKRYYDEPVDDLKAITIVLDSTDDKYDLNIYASNIRNSEIIALLEVTKQNLLNEMT